MTFRRYDPHALDQYRQKVAEVAELRKTLGDTIGQLQPEQAQQAFDELILRTKAMEDLKSSLGQTNIFLAKYGVDVINHHTVSFVIPRGCSRIEMLDEARQLVLEKDNRHLVGGDLLSKLRNLRELATPAASSEHICIDGNYEGTCNQAKPQQEQLLSSRGLTLPRFEDLVVAFALHWVATSGPLLQWYEYNPRAPRKQHSYIIRAQTEALDFRDDGLRSTSVDERSSHKMVAAAARIPLEIRPRR